jgi:hypothetical protein
LHELPDDESSKEVRQKVRSFFENALASGAVALGDTGPDLDCERRPIDTIVIHHTSAEPGYLLRHMNVVQLLNIYVPYFNNPTVKGEANLKGQPLWSNHVRDGRPVFYAYHWLMRMDGTFERLLTDKELGWHAANWDINCRSIAICLDNDYATRDPSPLVLQQLGAFIARQYPAVELPRIFGHGEVSKEPSVCPGTHFVSGWKEELVAAVRSHY